MSFDYNKWESELRSKVETHEFAFDDQAWAEMNQLLDQPTGTTAPKDTIVAPTAGKFTPWLMSGLVVTLIGLLSWWIFQTTTEKTIVLSNFNISITPEENPSKNQFAFENALSLAEAGNTSNPKDPKVFPADAIAPSKKRDLNLPTTLTLPLSPVISTSTKHPFPGEIFVADRSAAYLTPALWRNLTIPLLPTSLDDLSLTPHELKRRRNRRTLYPDVIENY